MVSENETTSEWNWKVILRIAEPEGEVRAGIKVIYTLDLALKVQI